MSFDAEAGQFVLGVRGESVAASQGHGKICLRMGLEVKAPVATKVGRFVTLQTDRNGTEVVSVADPVLVTRSVATLKRSVASLPRRTRDGVDCPAD